MIALTAPSLETLIKPGLLDEWKETKKMWFADKDSVEQSKIPGYLKPEFVSSDGLYIGLSAKVGNL